MSGGKIVKLVLASVSLIIVIGGVSTGLWIHIEHKREAAQFAAWQQKIDKCIVETLRQQHASSDKDKKSSVPRDRMLDVFDQVAKDEEVKQARKSCIDNDMYDEEHKHDRELYERAFPQNKKD